MTERLGLVQCWICGRVQYGRLRRCDVCPGMTEVLYVDEAGVERPWPLDLSEYRRRGIVVNGLVNDLGGRR